MAAVHQRWLGIPGPTDVITFDLSAAAGPGRGDALAGDIVLSNRSLSPAYGLAASSDGAKVFRYEPRSTSTSETAGSNRIPEQDLQWGDCEATGQFTLTIHLAPMKRSR